MIRQSKTRFISVHCRRFQRLTLCMSIAVLASCLWMVPAFTQEPTAQDMEQFRALYAELLLNPLDVDKTLEYAALAVKMHDYEAAIAPLERLLLTYPNASKLKVELGSYYMQLGAVAAAQAYFNEVKADDQAGDDVKARADEYLTQIAAEAS